MVGRCRGGTCLKFSNAAKKNAHITGLSYRPRLSAIRINTTKPETHLLRANEAEQHQPE
jgi:hypothetical protein